MGHVSPNLALLPTLTKTFDEVHYIGSITGIEREKIENLTPVYKNLFYHPSPATKLDRSNMLKNIKIPFVLLKAKNKSRKLLKDIHPDVLFSKGGYVSVPVVKSAIDLIPLSFEAAIWTTSGYKVPIVAMFASFSPSNISEPLYA